MIFGIRFIFDIWLCKRFELDTSIELVKGDLKLTAVQVCAYPLKLKLEGCVVAVIVRIERLRFMFSR